MDLQPYVDSLQRELEIAAGAGGEEARALAERLTAPLASALRLTLLDALSAAADEVSRDLAPVSVEVRLRGRDADFVVTPPSPTRLVGDGTERGVGIAADGMDEGGTSRINLRLPESLKQRLEEAARRERLSINAWLVRAVAATLEADDRDRPPERRGPARGQRQTGWVR